MNSNFELLIIKTKFENKMNSNFEISNKIVQLSPLFYQLNYLSNIVFLAPI
jgi:hypothetical protein